eukprot:TRINITY_DN8378_c0_g3_i1.p1 TRINITY_DN8378_c0_g3~~TRINITY_DN8378_c0_g3_i1.p1  ORF type:complete len:449 (-),score=95.57 TRINITY_DN8378_c0_g3_i1:29-1375(-)
MWQLFQLCRGGRAHSLDGGADWMRLCQAPRSNSDEVALFLFEQKDAVGIRSALEASVADDMHVRIRSSLEDTANELSADYPDENRDMVRLRLRSFSDLSDFVDMAAGDKDQAKAESTPIKPRTLTTGSASPGSPKALFSPTRSSPAPSLAASPSRPALSASQEFCEVPPPPPTLLPTRAPPVGPLEAERPTSVTPPKTQVKAEPPSSVSPPKTQVKETVSKVVECGGKRLMSHDNLVDHEQLMEAIYQAQGLDLGKTQEKAKNFLRSICMRPHDMGVRNTDDNGRELMNQCFYLSMARAYLGHEAPAAALALRLKCAIESAVMAARPTWASEYGLGVPGDTGVMAFADFLPVAMHAPGPPNKTNLLAELVVCILDSVAGHVEVYIGPNYDKLEHKAKQERNMLLLWYTPGHYQSLVRDDAVGSKVNLSYSEFKELLTERGVVYIETTE